MESSSTSSSRELRSALGGRWVRIIAVALALVIVTDLAARALDEQDPTYVDRLLDPPTDGSVYIIGNSMFHTGVNPDRLSNLLDQDVMFDYHGGHYTSMWYLMALNALPQLDVEPSLIVWGFRPRYALDPAFRQNRPNNTEDFASDDPAYVRLTTVEGVNGAGGSVAVDLLRTTSALYAARDDHAENLRVLMTDLALSLLGFIRTAQTEEFSQRMEAGDTTLIDEIVRTVTGGSVALADERVVDGVGDFIEGPTTVFTKGFLPLTVEQIQATGLDQLVVVWKPVTEARGEDIAVQDEFVAETVAYLEEHAIPYLNLYSEPRLTLDMFASGDHYNSDGRTLVTQLLYEKIEALR